MFGLFITATVLCFVLIFVAPFAASSRPPERNLPDTQEYRDRPPHRRGPFIFLRLLPFTVITFLTGLFTIAASVIATVMFSIFERVFGTNGAHLNIKAKLGTRMLAFMWIASGCTFLAFLLEFTTFWAFCCCVGRRNNRTQITHYEMKEREDLSSPEMLPDHHIYKEANPNSPF